MFGPGESAPGEARSAPAAGTQVTAEGLMALAPLAREAPGAGPLAERPGTVALRRQGQGHAIRDVRPFAEGDDPRHLDAAATARTGQPHIRRFHEDRERTAMLIADFRRPMLWGTRGRFRSVAAAEALALVGWREAAAGAAVGVAALTAAGILAEPPAPGPRGMARVAACLARAHEAALDAAAREANRGANRGARTERRADAADRPAGWLRRLTARPARRPADPGPDLVAELASHLAPDLTPDLAPDLARAARMAPRGALTVLASGLDRPGPDLAATLAGIVRRGPLHLILVEDAFEAAPPHEALPVPQADGRMGRAAFPTLAADRAARAAALRRPGITVERRPSHLRPDEAPALRRPFPAAPSAEGRP